MDNLENNAWVFDSLVGFLHGPVWNVPLQTFIEEKSLPFEPTDDGGVLDRPEYKKIHNEYRNLVDVMLGSFMEDIGITAEQFQAACHLSANDLAGLPDYFHKRLFEQIWAANDYKMFVKMMTHKNVELQFQALELIEKRYGAMPSLYSSDPEKTQASQSDVSTDWPDNDDVMTEIKKLQIHDIDTKDGMPEIKVGPEEVVAEKKSLLSKLQFFDGKDSADNKTSNEDELLQDFEPKQLPSKVKVTDEEIKTRQQYLQQQRDKLLALKKQVREKQLGAASNEVQSADDGAQRFIPRPKSSHAAKAVLSGTTPSPPPDAMQLRRALASKLKAEVVDSN